MRVLRVTSLILLTIAIVTAGCQKAQEDRQYDLKGQVVSVAADKRSVTLSHEDIPGFMKAMEMKFDVENPKLLENVQPGDRVEGRLRVTKDNRTTIVELKRVAPADEKADEEAKIKANLAKLTPEERKLAEAQEYCPIMEHVRLGAMGKPALITLKDQPVLLCCGACKQEAFAKPEQTLAKVEALKKKTRQSSKEEPN